ncbi:MAG: phosphoadenylyl-sulfate reductase [Hyphomicrobiales bacterium]|nr:phosphoadenylyl-sulfate reductase [Hyphomicrobiales bacterium]
MPIVTDEGFQADDWARAGETLSWRAGMIVPLDVAGCALDAIGDKGTIGIEIASGEEIDQALSYGPRVDLIAVRFEKFADGRFFSLGRRLRDAGFTGRLRAVGPLLPDQYAFARSCGFDEAEISGAHAAKKTEPQWRTAAESIGVSYQSGYSHAAQKTILEMRRAARRGTSAPFPSDDQLAVWEEVMAALDLPGRLSFFRSRIEGRIVFTTGFGLEDQAVVHAILTEGLDIDLVTLDTGRLFPETYDVWAATEKRYGVRITAIYPDQDELAALVAHQGINGFYESVEARKACCQARKVEPLNRALFGSAGWVTGIRADQSKNRNAMRFIEADRARGVVKSNPLLDWSRSETEAYAAEQGIVLNPLHEKGFASIGCAPCTRAIEPGEHERAGRWWWEEENKKECGLHTS